MKFKCDASDKETTSQAKELSYNVQKVSRQSLCKSLAKALLHALHLASAPTDQQYSLISLRWVHFSRD